jgi:nitrogen fixation/metabolism regulation signal transduction histidine kinase
MSLRTRLFLALLALALAPTLVFAWFTLVQLHEATARWYQAEVEQALESALETNRAALDRLEALALERADAWALALPDVAAAPAQREAMRRGLAEAGLEFAQVYERDAGGWTLVATIVPAGRTLPGAPHLGDALSEALAADRLVRTPSGVLAAVAPVADGVLLATGVRLNPGFWERLAELRKARADYLRAPIAVAVQRQEVWLTIALLVLAIAAAAAVLSRALASGMTQPVSRLTAAIERIQHGGEREPLAETGPRELASLAASFNAMTARLGEARLALQRAEREAAWREVARAIAHELKNALTPMRLSLHPLQRRVELVPERERAAVRESIEALIAEIGHITRLADHFAQFARMPEPRQDAVDLAQLARSCGALHEPRQAALRVACDGPLPVVGDRLLLSRALHNLIVNAVEASGEGGEVEVVSGASGGEAWVEVRDRGPGLHPDVAGRVFEPYVSTKGRGSGLGLSLVRDIAVQHRGSVTLVDREGGGAVARLSLPLATGTGRSDA